MDIPAHAVKPPVLEAASQPEPALARFSTEAHVVRVAVLDHLQEPLQIGGILGCIELQLFVRKAWRNKPEHHFAAHSSLGRVAWSAQFLALTQTQHTHLRSAAQQRRAVELAD